MRWLGLVLGAAFALPVAAEELVIAAKEKGGAPEEMTVATRAFGRIAAFPLPPKFVAVTERESYGTYLMEFVPEGETVDDWSQMITLTAAEGVMPDLGNPLEMGFRIGEGFQAACPETFWGSDEGVQPVPGAEAAHLLAFSCGDGGNGQSETVLVLLAASGDDLYTLQWAERGPTSDAPLTPEPSLWQVRGVTVLGLRLCPVREGEEPPYPSCVE